MEECEVYNKILNIDLFNKIVSIIINTTKIENKYQILSEIENRCIWYQMKSSIEFQEEYKFEYFGELLERYEERIGNDIRDVRAIALALGYAKKLIENEMFIGTQLVDFLLKIKNLAKNDIYLKGALYLYDKNTYSHYGDNITNEMEDKTEDMIFVLSVRCDDLEYVFNQKKEIIKLLLGRNNTLSVFGNSRVYAWVINVIWRFVNKTRTKELAGLRALIKLPCSYHKEESIVYKELNQLGYTNIAISYLNYMMLDYSTIPNTIDKIDSPMIVEKIVINLMKTILNSKETCQNYIYDLAKELFSKYYKFDIKCYGKSGIKEALIDEINIVNPETFIRFYTKFDRRLYAFDILDEKWDIVAEYLGNEAYEDLFDMYIQTVDKSKIVECIEKYNKIMGKNYVESFLIYSYIRQITFNYLVENNIIKLKEFFDKLPDKKQDSYLSNYIKGVHNRKSYDFLKCLVSLGEYNIEEINSFGFKLENLYENWHYKKLHIQKDFLSIDEQIFLFNCLETLIFYYNSDQYISFLDVVIEENLPEEIVSKETLRQIYLILLKFNHEKYDREYMREKYLTEKELNEIYEKERLQKEQEKARELKKIQNELKEEFQDLSEKNFERIYDFCDSYRYNEQKISICKSIAISYVLNKMNTFEKKNEDIIYFSKLLILLLSKNQITVDEYIKLNCEFWKEEVIKYGINNRTHKVSDEVA